MPESSLYLDRSGTLVPGVFFRFGTAADDRPVGKPAEGFVLSRRSPTEAELNRRGERYLTVEIDGCREVKHHRCPMSPDHVTEREVARAGYRVREPGRVADFVIDLSEGGIVSPTVSGAFAAKLRGSGLTGYNLVAAEPKRKADAASGADLHVLNFAGRNCERPVSVRGVPNACPHCGNAPLVCPECGDSFVVCPKCGKAPVVTPGTKEEPGALWSERLGRFDPPILNGSRWDGSDFVNCRTSEQGYISKRALDWLLSTHAAPFFAEPVLVCTDGMADEQRKKLEAAKRPVGGAH